MNHETLLQSPVSLFFVLLCGHAIADFALQTEWIATNKNRNIRKNFPAEQRAQMQVIWPHLLLAHAMHHGFMVFLISQNVVAAALEVVIHATSDFLKCEGWFGFHMDQFIHICSKAIWTTLLVRGVI